MTSKANRDRMCVVCSRTHPPTIFSCRYKVHPKNVDVLCSFFDRTLAIGELCDRCYRLWYKHRKQQEGGDKASPAGKRKKRSNNSKNRKKIKLDSNAAEDEEEEFSIVPTRTYPTRKIANASRQIYNEEDDVKDEHGYSSSASSDSSSSLPNRMGGTSNEFHSAAIKEDEENSASSNNGDEKKAPIRSLAATERRRQVNEKKKLLALEEEASFSYPDVLKAIVNNDGNNTDQPSSLIQKLEALSALSLDVRRSKRKGFLPMRSPSKEDPVLLFKGNDPLYLRTAFCKIIDHH